jgi:hypothetical protein
VFCPEKGGVVSKTTYHYEKEAPCSKLQGILAKANKGSEGICTQNNLTIPNKEAKMFLPVMILGIAL